MTRGTWALCERSLRLDARQFGAHLLRLAVIAVVYFTLLSMMQSAMRVGAPGLWFFSIVAYLNVVLLGIVGVRLFASVITEEKEDGTLPLMMLTGLSPLAILLGKSGSRLLQILSLLLVQLPVALFTVTLGGITIGQILAAVTAVAAYVVCLANVGLLSSVVLRRSGDATGATAAWALLYAFLLPPSALIANEVARSGSQYCPDNLEPALIACLRFLSEQSVFLRLNAILQTGFAGTPLCWQVVTNLAFGGVCFLTAWSLFPIANRELATEVAPRRLVAATKSTTALGWRTAGRPWSNSLMWLAFHFDAGGWPAIALKFIAYASVCLFVTYMQTEQFERRVRVDELFAAWAGTLSLLLFVEALLQAGRIFQNEYKAGTWSSLLTLPRSVAYLGYSKAWGGVLSMLPGMALCGLFWCAALMGHRRGIDEVFSETGFWMFMLLLAWLIHFIAWLSAYRRQSDAMVRLVGVAIVGFGLVFAANWINWHRLGISSTGQFILCDLLMISTGMAMHWSMGIQLARDDTT